MRTTRWIALAFFMTGCAPSFQLALPSRFVELQDASRGSYELRATTTDGVVVGVDVIPNREHATLEFWSDASRRSLRDGQGYELLSEATIDAASGQHGQLMRFGRDLSGHAYRYTLALFVTPDAIWVIEAGGRAEAYTTAESDIEQSISRMRF